MKLGPQIDERCPVCGTLAETILDCFPTGRRCPNGHSWFGTTSLVPPETDEDAEFASYRTDTREGVTAYVNAKLNQVLAPFQVNGALSPTRKKMAVNAIRVELRRCADRLGFAKIVCEEKPNGEIMIGVMMGDEEE